MNSSGMATEARHDEYKDNDDDDDKPIVFKRSDHNGDSEDARPLSSIIFRNSPLNRRPSQYESDDEDDAPISSRFQKKNGKQDSTNKNNSSTLENAGVPNKVCGKRLLDKGSSADQSSMKKLKVSSSSTSVSGIQSDHKRKVVVSSPKTLPFKEDETDDDDDVPISKRIKSDFSNSKKPTAKTKLGKQSCTSSATKSKVKRSVVSPPSKTRSKKSKKVIKDSKFAKSSKSLPSGDGKKKWTTLVHNGVTFPPPYEPHGVKILYKGKPVDLSPEQEEVATMFAVMRETNYYSKPRFRENFWIDWRKLLGENNVIQKLDDCDFTPIYDWHLEEKKDNDGLVKKASKEKKLKEEKYMWAIVGGVKEKVGSFNVEPPGLFCGRGEHPKIGKLKKRIHPCDVTLNLGKDAPIPECPIPGERWKGVKHYNTVTWLAFWTDPINPPGIKYISLSPSSSQKGQSDKNKYEKARNLKDHIDSIRASYTTNFTAEDVSKRQIAVAIYLIDKLALRAGNEKGDDEADTVGCCTLKVENVECVPPNKLEFDFLGKDSIQYMNTVEVEPSVYKAIGQFRAGKANSDDLFDELNTNKVNAYLKKLMPGLTATVFRTYNASITLDVMLRQETRDGDVNQKVVVYQQANKEVAIICNHQRTVSKSHGAQIERLAGKIKELKEGLKELRTNLERAKKGKAPLEGSDGKKTKNITPETLEKKIAQKMMKIEKMERDMQTKEELKTVALGTSKINYLDPRITVSWCKRHEVPIQKIFNKSLVEKFAWAMDVEPDFTF
ncbi:DNA topoisomerase 1 alpha [Capsella rubella]|nr:DNA topoisomerase 1 alpha [Capsella rubella]